MTARHRIENDMPLGLLPNMEIEIVEKFTPNRLVIILAKGEIDPDDETYIGDLNDYDDLFK